MNGPCLRQELRELIDVVPTILKPVFERQPLLAGRVYQRRYRCNQPNCHCQTGDPHSYVSLATWRDGKKDVHSIPLEDVEKLTRWCDSYRRLRKARAAVRRWYGEVVDLIDEIERSRRVSQADGPRGVGRAGGGMKDRERQGVDRRARKDGKESP